MNLSTDVWQQILQLSETHSGLLASKTTTDFCCFRPPSYSNLLQQVKETNIYLGTKSGGGYFKMKKIREWLWN